jgi:hypothetical protein
MMVELLLSTGSPPPPIGYTRKAAKAMWESHAKNHATVADPKAREAWDPHQLSTKDPDALAERLDKELRKRLKARLSG